MRKYSLVVLGIMFIMTPLYAEIYKWTDSSGNVHFSDKPYPGAEEIQLPKIQTYSSPKVAAPDDQQALPEATEIIKYKRLTIVQPLDQVTIRNPQGAVSVLLDLRPKLKEGDKLQLVLDGSNVGAPQATTNFSLQGIVRGSHTLAAQVVDKNGKILLSSDTISIYMMQPRVGMGGNP